MGVELSSERDLSRRIDARRGLEGQRARLHCKRCRKLIPEDRRVDSIYCSKECHNNYRREQTTSLRTEMRGTYRQMVAPTECECGERLDNRPGKRAPIRKSCRRCQNREAQRRRRMRLKESRNCGPPARTAAAPTIDG